MRSIVILLLTLTVAGCSSTYSGRIVTREGRSVAGAHIEAAEYPSLLGTPPWKWAPARFVRGSAVSDETGAFVLHASSITVEELSVTSPRGSALVRRPAAGQPLVITVLPTQKVPLLASPP